MKRLALIALALCGLMTRPAFGHRLDEYLQATILSVDGGRVVGTMRLVPGVAVSRAVLKSIDTDGDGRLSEAEQEAYARRVLHDVSLRADGRALGIQLVSVRFPSMDQMEQGLGEIEVSFASDLPGDAAPQTLEFENHHEQAISVYLVNCLVPSDATLRIEGQERNENQSFYRIRFTRGVQAVGGSSLPGLSGFGGAFRMGVRHIAEGTDHLLFLLTLLLPAPLLACAGRWSGRATMGRTMGQVFRIVTAFTVGHSVTLGLSAFGWVHLPSGPVEVLIAISILVSAIHAMRPIFPGREAAIAAFFGLIHGLAFASALRGLGFGHWYRVVSVLGFNVGIEAMQLVVVAATLPSLLLLSRTPVYGVFRRVAAGVAAAAAMAWIGERAFGIRNLLEPLMERCAHEGPWMALCLLGVSVLCWLLRGVPRALDEGAAIASGN